MSLRIATETRPVRNTSHPESHGRPRPSHARPTFQSLFGATELNYSACHILCLVLDVSSSFTPNLKKNGGRMGIVLKIASFGCLSGPPIGGRIIQHRDDDYLLAQVFR